MKQNVEFVFGPEHITAFEELQRKLVERPLLGIFNPLAETQLHTDACSSGFGAILMQKGDDEQFHPIMYYSKKASVDESKLHSFELETLAIVYALKRFHIYLYGKEFKILTDCNALKCTLEKKEINAKIARWSLFIDQYRYTVEHRKSESMKHVDALSRVNVFVMTESHMNHTNAFTNALYVNQLKDAKIKSIMNSITNGGLKDYEIRNGIVYRKVNNKSLLYVPECMELSVIVKYHDCMGHFSDSKVVSLISRLFWFPQMRSKVLEHIKRCILCIAFNPKPHTSQNPLINIDKGNVPFYKIHIDHLGPLPITKGKNVYVFAVVDAFSKFIKLYPTKSTNCKEALKHLKSYFFNYSMVTEITSDRGTSFTSVDFQNFVDERRIKHSKIGTACPQANGQVERYNRTFVPVLSKLSSDQAKDWDSILIDVEFFMNNTINKSTGLMPSVVLFGIPQRRENENELVDMIGNVFHEFERDFTRIRQVASENIVKQQNYNKEYHDKSCRLDVKFSKGDLVMIRTNKIPGQINKLNPKFRGPYQIKEVLDYNRYVIEDVPGFQVTNVPFSGIYGPANMRLFRDHQDQDDILDSEHEEEHLQLQK